MTHFLSKNYTSILRRFLFGLGILFLMALIVNSWEQLQHLWFTIHWPLFILSILISCLSNWLASLFFKELLHKYGIEVTHNLVYKLFFYAQIAKYIPGKIWILFYQATLVGKIGASRTMLFANIDLMAILVLISATISLSLISLDYYPILAGLFFLLGLLLTLFIGKFCYLFNSLNYLLSHFKSLKNKLGTCHTEINSWLLITYYTFFWMTYLIANFLMMFAIFSFSISESTHYIAYLGLAWIIGVIAFLVPSGIGVREFVFILLAQQTFSQHISLDLLAMIAIMSRFWIILQEITAVVVLQLWNFFYQLKD